ncbi:hypothetical protein [Parasphingorhabdus sp.]
MISAGDIVIPQYFATERPISGWARVKKQALIDEDWDLLCQLAQNRADDG